MAQNWFVYAWIFPGLVLIVGLVIFLKRRDTLMHKQLGEIQDSQAELLRKVSGREPGSGPFAEEREFPEAPKFRLASQDPAGLRRAETELLTKVRAVRSGADPSGDHAG